MSDEVGDAEGRTPAKWRLWPSRGTTELTDGVLPKTHVDIPMPPVKAARVDAAAVVTPGRAAE